MEQNLSIRRFWLVLLGLMAGGFILRWYLAFDLFLNQGFAWDLATFVDWMLEIDQWGYDAYTYLPGMNYPPVFADILQVLLWLGKVIGPWPLQDVTTWTLLKLPSVFADLGIAGALAFAGRRWYSSKVGLIAAGFYLFIPVTWYVSAVWGQVDSLSALPMLLAVIFVIDKRPELSAVFLVLAVLTKPQGALVVLILLPVLIGQILHKELRSRRLWSTIGSGLLTFVLIAVPWSLESYVNSSLKNVPVIGDLLGLIYQYFATAGLFPVLTANAYNPWALVGTPSLAQQIETGTVYWRMDNLLILGVPAGIWGSVLFLALAGFIFWTLIKKHNAQQVFTAFALLLVGFFILPTRVHERYLAQAFAVLALVWAVKIWQRLALITLAVANTVNMHAILAANLQVYNAQVQASASGGLAGGVVSALISPRSADPASIGIDWVRMPADWARIEWVVWAVVAIHTAAFIALLVDYLGQRKSRTQ